MVRLQAAQLGCGPPRRGELELESFRTDPHARLEDFIAGAEPRAPEVAGVPSRIELNPDGTLDGQSIEKQYFGFDLSAAEQLYSEGLLNETEALVFMGPIALAFYWQAVDAYCRSAQSKGDEYVLSLDHVLERFTFSPLSQDPEALRRGLQTTVYVLEHWSKFESASSVYIPSRSRWQVIQSKLQALAED